MSCLAAHLDCVKYSGKTTLLCINNVNESAAKHVTQCLRQVNMHVRGVHSAHTEYAIRGTDSEYEFITTDFLMHTM